MKVLHLITSLTTGGAETMLLKVVGRHLSMGVACEVVVLTEDGPIGAKLRALGVQVHALGMRRGVPDPRAIFRAAAHMKRYRPDVVQTWMYHADLLGGMAGRWVAGHPVLWNIRHSNLEPGVNKRSTILTAKVCAFFSRILPARIVCCSEAALRVHAAIGYDAQRMVVIPNGFDLGAYKPDPEARARVRAELGIPEAALLLGLVGRFDPLKDHANFFEAARRLLELRDVDARFLLCGDGITWDNPALAAMADGAGLRERTLLLGRRDDVPALTAAFDLSVSSSRGEGFPNVVGEAMASGVPCVVTDVGDSALIVGDTGGVVPSQDAEALAAALAAMVDLGPEGRRRLGERAMARVQANYRLEDVALRYLQAYAEAAGSPLPELAASGEE